MVEALRSDNPDRSTILDVASGVKRPQAAAGGYPIFQLPVEIEVSAKKQPA
jgi:hypothetical protein